MTSPAATPEKAPSDTFDSFIYPLHLDTFFQKYLDQKPIHIPGNLKKFPQLMSFDRLNDLLSMSFFWSSQTLQLTLEGQMIDPRFYCVPLPSQNGVTLRPACEKVMDFLSKGAALVCNDMDCLTPELRHIHRLLGHTFQAKVQANLYVSWQQKQAFRSHFDTHDVWAFQTVGEKTWRLYQGRADHPVAHPSFKNFGQDHHDKAKGNLDVEVLLKPGDILYIPRGVYHDALASSSASIHVTFGVTRPIGLDLLSLLFEQALSLSFFRQNVPVKDRFRYLKQFEKECTHLINSKDFQEAVSHLSTHFSSSFPEYHLPNVNSQK